MSRWGIPQWDTGSGARSSCQGVPVLGDGFWIPPGGGGRRACGSAAARTVHMERGIGLSESDDSTKTLGEHIAARRRMLGCTQEELAVLLHITPRTLRDWERDRSIPASEHHQLIELVLHWRTEIWYILEGWVPWEGASGLKRLPSEFREAPPGREESWRRARAKVDAALEAIEERRDAAKHSGKKGAKTT